MATWKLYAYVGYPEDRTWPNGPANTAALGAAESWVVSPGDAAAWGMIADGLALTRSIPGDKPWPAQYEPATLTFQVIAQSVADVPHLVRGRPVSLYFHLEAAPAISDEPDEWFHGRITDVVLNPHPRGVIAQVTCVDYTVDLADLPAGTGDDRPTEDLETRLTALLDPVSPYPSDADTWFNFQLSLLSGADVIARSAAASTAYDLAVDAVEQGVETLANPDYPYRYVVLPIVDDVQMNYTDEVAYNYWQGFTLRDVPRDWQPGDILVPPYAREVELPATFGVSGDGYGVVIDPDVPTYTTGQMVVEAGATDMSVAWVQRKAEPNTIEVVGPWGPGGEQSSVQATTGAEPQVIHVVETELVDQEVAEQVAIVYLPADVPDAWATEQVTWYLDQEQGHPKTPELGGLIVIWPIKTEWNPNGDRDYHLALVGAKTLTITDGKPRMTLTLRAPSRRITDPVGGAHGLWWDDVPVGVSWADLNTRDSWADYGLIRSS